MPLSEEQREAITELLFIGHKIAAIKIYRQATGSGLKESKDFVDTLEAHLQQQMPERFKIITFDGPPAGFVLILLFGILLVGGAIGAYLFFNGFR